MQLWLCQGRGRGAETVDEPVRGFGGWGELERALVRRPLTSRTDFFMRTAVTLARTHDGEWELVAGPDVPVLEQVGDFRKALVLKSHPELAEIRYQESDGITRVHRLRSPKDHKAHEALRASERAAQKKANQKLAAKNVEAKKPQKQTEDKKGEGQAPAGEIHGTDPGQAPESAGSENSE